MKLTGITNHAKQRISERSKLNLYEIVDIINAQRFEILGSKPGINKIHLLIYSIPDNAWFVLVRDSLNGDVLTLLTEAYHVRLFGQISDQQKKRARYIATHGFNENNKINKKISLFLGYVDVSGKNKTKRIWRGHYEDFQFSCEAFLHSSELQQIMNALRTGKRSSAHAELPDNIETCSYLKVMFSDNDNMIIDL